MIHQVVIDLLYRSIAGVLKPLNCKLNLVEIIWGSCPKIQGFYEGSLDIGLQVV